MATFSDPASPGTVAAPTRRTVHRPALPPWRPASSKSSSSPVSAKRAGCDAASSGFALESGEAKCSRAATPAPTLVKQTTTPLSTGVPVAITSPRDGGDGE